MRAVTASKTCVTGTVRRGAFAVAATAAWMRSTLAARILHADNVRVLGQFRDGFDRHLVRDKLGNVVEHDGQRRAVGYAAEVVENGSGGHLPGIVAGRANENGVVLVLCRGFGQFDCRFDAFAADAGDEDLFRRRASAATRRTSRDSASLSMTASPVEPRTAIPASRLRE